MLHAFPERQPALESELETVLNMSLRLLPMAVKAPIAATETSAAMRPYSMAVAPSSFLAKQQISLNMAGIPFCANLLPAEIVEGQLLIRN